MIRGAKGYMDILQIFTFRCDCRHIGCEKRTDLAIFNMQGSEKNLPRIPLRGSMGLQQVPGGRDDHHCLNEENHWKEWHFIRIQ